MLQCKDVYGCVVICDYIGLTTLIGLSNFMLNLCFYDYCKQLSDIGTIVINSKILPSDVLFHIFHKLKYYGHNVEQTNNFDGKVNVERFGIA